MKRTWLLFVCIGGLTSNAFAQGAMSAEPKHYFNPQESKAVRPALKAAQDADAYTVRIRLDPPEASQKKALEENNSAPGLKALQIGFPRSVAFDSSALIWRELPDGGRVARFSVTSPEAAALRLGLVIDRFDGGAELRFFGSADPSLIYGPITGANLHLSEPIYWSPVLEGDTVTAEIYVGPGLVTQAIQFTLEGVSHLVATATSAMVPKVGEAESCNYDVACIDLPQGLRDAAKAVARFAFTKGGKSYLCTGTLLADTDGRNEHPFFYTAHHCIDRQLIASTVHTYWFYEAANCGGSLSPALRERYGGATFLYSDGASDAALIELRDTPPSGAVYAGWDASVVTVGDKGVTLHHPGGDLKKVSEGEVAGYATEGNRTFIGVKWGRGSTQRGSSGSGLFVANGDGWYLRGGLYGGTASCSNPQGADYFSRLDLAYPSIQKYLDPIAEKVALIEFYNASLDHYFVTHAGEEIVALDSGDTPGWARTGHSLDAYETEQGGTSAVCRIYIPPGMGDGHYYGRDKAECDGTMAKNPSFVLESPNFFYLYPTTGGNCAQGQTPVFRLYSNRRDTNHRYVTSRAERDNMVAKGWLAEGDGPAAVVMCAP